MSYCRFSTDDFRCDLYCYEDELGGWTTHVAAVRTEGEIPRVSWSDGAEVMLVQYQAQMAFLETAERLPIGLPSDGMTFSDDTLEEFRERLAGLKAAGYRFPEEVFQEVDEEIMCLLVRP